MDVELVPPPAPPNSDLPLLSLSLSPRFIKDVLVSVLHSLMIKLALLYLVPSLFSDPTAQALAKWCWLDLLVDGAL